MKKSLLVLFVLMAGLTTVFGQAKNPPPYLLKTISDIQYLPDTTINTVGDGRSPLQGDTVRIRGVVLVRPVVDPVSDRRRVIAAGARWHIYLQDSAGQPWGGLAVLQMDTSVARQGTFFDLVDTAQIVEFTGVVNEFVTVGQSISTTQFEILVNPVTPVNVIGQLPKRPEPLELSVTDFMENGVLKRSAEKYEGMYVQIRNVFSSDRSTSSGTFKINDGQGNYMFMYDQSGFFTKRAHRLTGITTYEPPLDGTAISKMRGVIQTRQDGYYLTPLYPGDIVTGATPPSVSSVRRDKATVPNNTSVTVTSTIVDFDGRVNNAKIKYRVNGGQSLEVPMTKGTTDTTQYSGVIPGIASDSAFVEYYILAYDNEGRVGQNPADTNRSRFSYFSLNPSKPLTIQHLQYSPLGSGFSSYNNYRVTVSGVVTTDTSDIPGFGTSTPLRVTMQNGSGPWSGITLNGIQALTLKRGDNITVSGLVNESFDVTRIDSITQLIVNSSNNPSPAAVTVSTRTISNLLTGSPAAEQYESVLLKYENVTVVRENADGNPGVTNNFGEIGVADTSNIVTRVELQDGNHKYHNSWDSTVIRDPSLVAIRQGDRIGSLTGVMYFSFSNFKLCPRKDSDISGLVSDARENNNTVTGFSLNQNYPNPFNPTTTISYDLKEGGFVSINVYNTLGQLVRSLVNLDQNAGNYRVIFDARDLSSGTYYYSIKVNNYSTTRKMLLLK